MSVTPNRGSLTPRRKAVPSSPLHQAFRSLYTEIVDFEQSFTESSTAAFLKPEKYAKTDCTISQPKVAKIPPEKPESSVLTPRKLRENSEKKGKKDWSDTGAGTDAEDYRLKSELKNREKLTLPPVAGTGTSWLVSEGSHYSPLLPQERSPRFPVTFREKLEQYRPSIRELSPEEIRDLTARIHENISKAKQSTFEERLKVIKERSVITDQRLQLRRTARLELAGSKRKKIAEELEEKHRKFEWRRNAGEITSGKEMWWGVLGAVGVLWTWGLKLQARKVKCI